MHIYIYCTYIYIYMYIHDTFCLHLIVKRRYRSTETPLERQDYKHSGESKRPTLWGKLKNYKNTNAQLYTQHDWVVATHTFLICHVHPYFGVVWSNLRSLIFQIQVGWFNGPTMGGIIPASKSPNEAEIRVFGGWKNSGGGGATFLFLWKYFEKHITLPKFNVNFFSPLKVSDLDRK